MSEPARVWTFSSDALTIEGEPGSASVDTDLVRHMRFDDLRSPRPHWRHAPESMRERPGSDHAGHIGPAPCGLSSRYRRSPWLDHRGNVATTSKTSSPRSPFFRSTTKIESGKSGHQRTVRTRRHSNRVRRPRTTRTIIEITPGPIVSETHPGGNGQIQRPPTGQRRIRILHRQGFLT